MAGKRIKYTPELANKICGLIAEGNSVLQVTKMKGMPKTSAIYDWLDKHPDFADKYARACGDRADGIFDDMLEIADHNSEDQYITEEGKELTNGEAIQRSKLRVDTRKWMLARMNPRKYSERLIHAGDDENPVKTVTEVKLGFVRSGSEPSDT